MNHIITLISVCTDYLGVESGEIVDSNIQASNTAGSWAAASKGRLNGPSCWATYASKVEPWIQADIGYQTDVSGVVTQGGGTWDGALDWVTSVKVSTFKLSTNDEQVFIENKDGTHMVGKRLYRFYYQKRYVINL